MQHLTKRKKIFKKIYIEILNYCNFNCSFCPKTNREPKVLNTSNFKKILLETKDYTDIFCLHVMGEPTLHPNFGEILKICDEQNVTINLVTNGSRLEEAGEQILKSTSIKKISFSLNAYNTIEDKNLETILNFAIAAGRTGKVVELKFFNEGDLYFYAKEYIYGQNSPNVFLRLINQFKWPEQTLLNKKERTSFCLGGKTHIAILCDGTVVPCCLDSNAKIPMGNILETNLKDILKGERFSTFIESFQKGKPNEQFCKTCEFKK